MSTATLSAARSRSNHQRTRLALRAAMVAGAIATATTAQAQTDNRLAIGASVTTRVAGSSTAGNSADLGFDWRLGHEDEGWGPQTSLFGWFDTTPRLTGVQATDPGALRIRPIMGGYGYTWVRGRTAVTADLVGGVAFNSFHLDAATIAEYERRGATGIRAEASNTFALKPEVQVWYDVNRRIGLKLTGGYLMTRPTVTIQSSFGSDKSAIRADSVLITFGIVYSII